MIKTQETGERIMRFHALYARLVKEDFDRAEFELGDLYAFQAFEHALRSDNQEFHYLAPQRRGDADLMPMQTRKPGVTIGRHARARSLGRHFIWQEACMDAGGSSAPGHYGRRVAAADRHGHALPAGHQHNANNRDNC